MHLLIPFASALSDAAVHALGHLELPNLARLLARLEPASRIGTDEYSLTPPHERAEAEALGLQGGDGGLPWAARLAATDGVAVGDRPWGLLQPAHWNVGREQVTLADPAALNLAADESRRLLDAVRESFESEGFVLAFGDATRWYASHEALDGLATASIDRVIGRNVDLWLGDDPRMRLMRRLQSEVQMTLYTHPINDERESRGKLAVNSFWLSGCGRAQPLDDAKAPTIDHRLRAPLLAEDWATWAEAWRALDGGPLAALLLEAQQGRPVQLTLCGERHAQRFDSAPRTLWQKLSGRWRAVSPQATLEAL